MNERYCHVIRKLRWWAAGIAVALVLALSWSSTHHVVRTEKGTVIVPKRFVTLSGTFVNLRTWQWKDVDRHPDMRDALVQAGYKDLLPQPQGGMRLARATKNFTAHAYVACCRNLQKAAGTVASWIEWADARCFSSKS
ncbi:MAG: hypothetical protein ACOYOU_20895 [Kiritimatiellia bacterium]